MTVETFVVIIGAVGGVNGIIELVRYFATRKASQRQALAAAQQAKAEADDKWFEKYEHQLERMNSQIEFKDKRIDDLNEENAEKEKRFREQTKRLRECQDREYKAQQEVNRVNAENHAIIEENNKLKLELVDFRCIDLTCADRKPENVHSRKAREKRAAELQKAGVETCNNCEECDVVKCNQQNKRKQ